MFVCSSICVLYTLVSFSFSQIYNNSLRSTSFEVSYSGMDGVFCTILFPVFGNRRYSLYIANGKKVVVK